MEQISHTHTHTPKKRAEIVKRDGKKKTQLYAVYKRCTLITKTYKWLKIKVKNNFIKLFININLKRADGATLWDKVDIKRRRERGSSKL